MSTEHPSTSAKGPPLSLRAPSMDASSDATRIDPYDGRPMEAHPVPRKTEHDLTDARRHISDIDRRIVGLLSERVRLDRRTREIERGVLRLTGHEPEAEAVRSASGLAADLGLDREEVGELFGRIIRMRG